MRINISKNPTRCPKCDSKNISLENKQFKKNLNGEITDVMYLGLWMCGDCGNDIRRRIK